MNKVMTSKRIILAVTILFVFGLTSFSQAINSNVGLEIGNQAPDIRLPSPDGDTIRLASLKGKIVLIDFWASWCAPCVQEQPQLKLLYSQYKNRSFINADGFTIYGVSLDSKKNDWVNAIQKLKIEWPQVSDLKFWNSAAASLYKLEGIPANFLIDGNGVIIAKDIHDEVLSAELAKLLKNQAINNK